MTTKNELSDLMITAYGYQKNNKLSLAIQAWAKLSTHPEADKELIANAYLNLGNLHLSQGNDELAIESMTGAIKANPNSSEAYYCLAYLEQEKENFKQAVEYFKQALSLNKTDVGAFNNLGNCYDRLDQTQQAIKAYTQAIKLNSKYISAIYNRGNAYMKIAKDDLALVDLTHAIELDGQFYQAYYNISILLKRLGRLAEAEVAAKQAKTLAQQDLEQRTTQ
jgi:tetratricopeptide (TPR) repeat protein